MEFVEAHAWNTSFWNFFFQTIILTDMISSKFCASMRFRDALEVCCSENIQIEANLHLVLVFIVDKLAS